MYGMVRSLFWFYSGVLHFSSILTLADPKVMVKVPNKTASTSDTSWEYECPTILISDGL
jgi:hypothetical protein